MPLSEIGIIYQEPVEVKRVLAVGRKVKLSEAVRKAVPRIRDPPGKELLQEELILLPLRPDREEAVPCVLRDLPRLLSPRRAFYEEAVGEGSEIIPKAV